MVKNTTKVRVRYGETDPMGIVNNAVYPSWYEVGRTMMFRELGFSYKKMEETGIVIPLSDLYVKYHAPAFYDEELTIVTYPFGKLHIMLTGMGPAKNHFRGRRLSS